ncbi:MAG TPA: hypothetical protein VHC86_07970 [Opitutaceae bacterium]|nr:hypothetical protein [Opitutaceae bacterium]
MQAAPTAPASAPRAIRLAGAAAVLAFLLLIGRFWHPVWGFSYFIQAGERYRTSAFTHARIAAFRSEPVYIYRDSGSYDGLYYSQIAYHPLLGSPELRPAIDNLPYRARRILPSALAWLLAAGRPGLIVQVYAVLNVAAWLALAALLWRLLAVRDLRTWLAWAGLLFSAGALGSVREALTDLIALALIAAAMLRRERGRGGAGWLAAAALTRETSLLAFPGLAERPWLSRANFRRAAAAVLPLAAWALYVRWRAGPDVAEPRNFTWPLLGALEKARECLAEGLHPPNPFMATLAWTGLLALAGTVVQAAYLLRRRDPADAWWRLGLPYVALLAVLGGAVWEDYPGAFVRVLLPLGLAFAVRACRTRASLAWIVAGNLSVLSGLFGLRYVPFDNREIAAARSGPEAAVVRVEDGWGFTERHRSHVYAPSHLWSWSAGTGALAVRAWPASLPSCRLDFQLRSLVPRTVTVRQGGAILWSGPVGAAKVAVSVPVRLENGAARLEFTTDAPPVPDPGDPAARSLAFAIYDAAVRLP